MHYSSGHMGRVNQQDGLDKARKDAASIREQIKHGDDDLSRAADRDPFDVYGNMQRATAWRHQRQQLVNRLNKIEQAVQWQSPDNSWRPSPSGYFTGSDA